MLSDNINSVAAKSRLLSKNNNYLKNSPGESQADPRRIPGGTLAAARSLLGPAWPPDIGLFGKKIGGRQAWPTEMSRLGRKEFHATWMPFVPDFSLICINLGARFSPPAKVPGCGHVPPAVLWAAPCFRPFRLHLNFSKLTTCT